MIGGEMIDIRDNVCYYSDNRYGIIIANCPGVVIKDNVFLSVDHEPDGIFWERTGGKTYRVTIHRHQAAIDRRPLPLIRLPYE
jgi:hypothetical protein